LGALREVAVQRGPATIVLLKDDRSRKPSLDGAFGTLVQEAADLMVNPRVVVRIEPPPADADKAGLTKPARFDGVLALGAGAVTVAP
jgi:hypothetical protein